MMAHWQYLQHFQHAHLSALYNEFAPSLDFKSLIYSFNVLISSLSKPTIGKHGWHITKSH